MIVVVVFFFFVEHRVLRDSVPRYGQRDLPGRTLGTVMVQRHQVWRQWHGAASWWKWLNNNKWEDSRYDRLHVSSVHIHLFYLSVYFFKKRLYCCYSGSTCPSKRTSVSSFHSAVDSDSAASINLNMEQDNVNFHIKKQAKYPHVPPHPAEQKSMTHSDPFAPDSDFHTPSEDRLRDLPAIFILVPH